MKICRPLERKALLKILITDFLEELMLFLLALKSDLLEKVFSSVKTKISPNFAVKLAPW